MSEPIAGDETRLEPDGASTTGMPRWVKVSLLVVGLLIAIFIVLQLAGVGGDHGPGRHMPGGQEPSSSETEHRPPAGVDYGG